MVIKNFRVLPDASRYFVHGVVVTYDAFFPQIFFLLLVNSGFQFLF